MTDYNDISNARVDADSPMDVNLITQLRDNPIAIAEGDATAPSVLDEALESMPGRVLASGTFSGASSVTIDLDDTGFEYYTLYVKYNISSNSITLRMRLLESGTPYTGAVYSETGAASQSYWEVMDGGRTLDQCLTAQVFTNNAATGDAYASWLGFYQDNASGNYIHYDDGGPYSRSVNTIDGVHLYPSSGTITGQYILVGGGKDQHA